MKTTGILVLDLGSPTTTQVVRRLRHLGVYAEVHPADVDPTLLASLDPRGVVLSGGAGSAPGAEPLVPRRSVLDAGLPVLALGDGLLLLATRLRGKVRPADPAGWEVERVGILRQSPLFETLLNEGRFATWMRTGDTLDDAPPGFVVTAKGDRGRIAAMEHLSKRLFALRFHPEQPETEHGLQILANFAHDICESAGNWDIDDHAKMCAVSLRSRVGSARVACALDPAPASLVAAALAARATTDGLVTAVIDDGSLDPTRLEALLAFSRQVLGRDASVVAAADLPPGPDARREALARRLEASFVITPPGRPDTPARPERRSGATPPAAAIVHVMPLGELFPDEILHLAEVFGVPQSLFEASCST